MTLPEYENHEVILHNPPGAVRDDIVIYRAESVPHDIWLDVCRYYDFPTTAASFPVVRGSEQHIYMKTLLQIRSGAKPRFEL